MANHLSASLVLAALMAALPAAALNAAPGADGLRGSSAPDIAAPTEARERSRAELERVEQSMRDNAELQKKLAADIEAARTDRGRLNAGLIDSAQKLRASESRMAALEQRLSGLEGSEQAVRESLQSRRALITEVLAALQRMGRKPPPAIFVRPDDILASVRAAIALGAVMPELRGETQALAADLASLVRIREGMAEERNRLSAEMQLLSAERLRIAALMDARQQQLKDSEKSASAEAQRAAALAQQAGNLRELLQKFESDIAAATRAAEEAARAQAGLSRETQDRMAALATRDPARLQPKIAFAQTQGTLNLPVGGAILRKFGDPDDSGSPARGVTLAGRSGAIVTAPADAWVAYAGPFRSFGHLLILNAGGGYYVLLAGMERMTVELGQFVLAGEPVAVMGRTPAQAVSRNAAVGADTNQPVLYVEFRKDGASIDPAPWWARSDIGKVRG